MLRTTARGLLLLIAMGCNGLAPKNATLSGKVYRGPVTPVCQIDTPCEAPFSAAFEVRHGSVAIATFTSGADGSFSVQLPAGAYTVVPGSTAPIMDPGSQTRSVVVEAGVTVLDLHFDTGIR